MTKFYFTTLITFISLASFGQAIVLDQSYRPTLEDKFTSYFLPKSAQPGNGGANQTWDFSALKQDSSFGNIAAPIPAARKAAYPNADLMQVTSYNDTTFYQVGTGSELINWGYYSSFLGATVYTDGQLILKYTSSYLDTYKDSVIGKSSIKLPASTAKLNTLRKGEAVITYDGWGSLSLPGGKNYPKVARIKSVLSGKDSVLQQGIKFTALSTITSYSWYAEGINYPVLNITAINAPGLVTDQVVIQSDTYVPASTKDQAFANSIHIAPNPAQDILNIDLNTLNTSTITLTVKDPSGKTLLYSSTSAVSGQALINVSSLNQGLYLLEIESNGLKAVKKIVKN